MPTYYTYLIASLPMLRFGEKPPISFSRFLDSCKGLIADKDLSLLESIPRPRAGDSGQKTLDAWMELDTALRNELVKLRAAKTKTDPSRYLHKDGYADSATSHTASAAYRTPHLLEGEKILDKARWHMLDELNTGHYFDIDFLILYGIKLLMLEKWDTIEGSDKEAVLEKALVRG